MTVLVRRARESDAGDACETVRRSIVELCVEDHRGDRATLDAWLANKTADNFASWITSERHAAWVAETEGQIVGFALLNRAGTVALLYVSPSVRFTGVSKILLAALEDGAIALGIDELRLSSTATAEHFYRRRGYLPNGDPEPGFGVTLSRPMTRRIAPSPNNAAD